MRRAALLALAALAVARRQDLARWWIAATGTVVRLEQGPSPIGAAGTTPRVPPTAPAPTGGPADVADGP